MPPDPPPTKRCPRCGRRFGFVRRTKRYCGDRCRDTVAHAAQRARAAAPADRIPLAVRRICPVCGRPFYATAKGGAVQRYDRAVCKRTAEKLAAIGRGSGS